MFHQFPQIRIPQSLRRLFPQASFVGCADIRVDDATEKSGECQPGQLFAALSGTRSNGHHHVQEAVANGASALLVEKPMPDIEVPQCVVPNARRAYAELCSALAGCPSARMSLVGVTGTNGKTTTTWLVRSILQAAQRQTGLIGTIEYHNGRTSVPSHLTTPDSRMLADLLSAMVLQGTTHAAMELSSHALHQERVAGTRLRVALVTNVTQDHFDYHKTYPEYLKAKARIQGHLRADGVLLLNEDDEGCRKLKAELVTHPNVLTYGFDPKADFTASILEESLGGTRFLLKAPGQFTEVRSPLIGRHNVSNCLAAAAACSALGVAPLAIATGLESTDLVPGRLQKIQCGQPFSVLVDYAHTDDAIKRCLECLKPLTHGRLICLFGAGGDRDPIKRPLMGKAASVADELFITSDNPRSEKPMEIIQNILDGVTLDPAHVHVEADRVKAIKQALKLARPGDCVVIAGKGHEQTQTIGNKQHPFDDCQVAGAVLGSLGYTLKKKCA